MARAGSSEYSGGFRGHPAQCRRQWRRTVRYLVRTNPLAGRSAAEAGRVAGTLARSRHATLIRVVRRPRHFHNDRSWLSRQRSRRVRPARPLDATVDRARVEEHHQPRAARRRAGRRRERAASGALHSDDTRYMAAALNALGVAVESDEADATLPHRRAAAARSPRRRPISSSATPGTTMRFLTAALPLGRGRYRIDGVPRMRLRPIAPLLDGAQRPRRRCAQRSRHRLPAGRGPRRRAAAAGRPGWPATLVAVLQRPARWPRRTRGMGSRSRSSAISSPNRTCR